MYVGLKQPGGDGKHCITYWVAAKESSCNLELAKIVLQCSLASMQNGTVNVTRSPGQKGEKGMQGLNGTKGQVNCFRSRCCFLYVYWNNQVVSGFSNIGPFITYSDNLLQKSLRFQF